MAEKIVVFNRALLLLGDALIDDPVSPESNAGKCLAVVYEQIRRAILTKYLWNFAEVTAQTDRIGTSQNPSYTDDYLYPDKCLRLLKLVNSDGLRLTDYRLAFNTTQNAKAIQVDNNGNAKLKVIFTYDQEDLAFWPPLVAEVLSIELAIAAANSVLGKENRKMKELEYYLSEALKDAVAVDGQEQPMQVDTTYDTEQARLESQWPDYYPFFTVKKWTP